MDEKKYKLNTSAGLLLRAEDLDGLLRLGDGNCALLYLWLLRSGGTLDEGEAVRALHLTQSALRAALERLRQNGLLGEGTGSEKPLPPPDELPEYRSEDVVRRSREDPAFQALVREAQAKLGHTLSTADLKKLFGIYDYLGLPCDVIMLLINRCAESIRKRYGETRLPTMYAIEKEAQTWCRMEILTLEQAEEFILREDQREERSERLRRMLQIRDRQPTSNERRYMNEWLDMDFPDETLELAYERTIEGTGKLAWKYMDAILRSWRDKGLRTPEEIEKGDRRPQGRKPRTKGGESAAVWSGDDLDRAERLLDHKE